MALTFPSNPTLNQVYSTGSLSWTWNGKSWNNGTSILATSNLVSSSVQFTNGNTTAFDTNSNITVGQITASFAKITNLTVQYITSSVVVITGSNKFGDASNDTQEFTGSVNMSGSLSVVGNITSNNVLSLASGTVSLPSLILSTDTTSGMYRIGANNIGISISAAKVLDISSTGLSVTGALSATNGYNGTVGATTANTGAFTTLSASSTGLVTGTFGVGAAPVSEKMRVQAAAGYNFVVDSASSSLRISGVNDADSANVPFIIQGSTVKLLNSSGDSALLSGGTLAVTGALSVTKSAGGDIASFTNTSSADFAINCTAGVTLLTPSTGILAFGTNSTERVRLTSAGLEVKNYIYSTQAVASGGNYIQVYNPSDTGGDNTRNAGINFVVGSDNGTSAIRSYRTNSASNYETALAFLTNPSGATQTPTEKMRIDASGNVGIGTTSPAGILHAYGANANVHIGSSTSGTGGLLTFSEATTPSWQIGAPAGANSYFNIKDSYNNVDRLRITQTGNLLVGTTNQGYGLFSSSKLTIGTSGDGICVGGLGQELSAYTTQANNNTGTRYFAYIANASSAQVGTISFTSSGTSYNTSSDYRRKSNIKELTGSGTFIDALKPRTFDWDTGDKGVGFIAHEFAEVSPSSVVGEKDAVDADGNPRYQSMQASSSEVIANLVAELQSVRARLAVLEAK
jgi:hypothetical protein